MLLGSVSYLSIMTPTIPSLLLPFHPSLPLLGIRHRISPPRVTCVPAEQLSWIPSLLEHLPRRPLLACGLQVVHLVLDIPWTWVAGHKGGSHHFHDAMSASKWLDAGWLIRLD